MSRLLGLPLLLALCLPLPSSADTSPPNAAAACFNVSIPYPFGLIGNYTVGRRPLPGFEIFCNRSSGPMLSINNTRSNAGRWIEIQRPARASDGAAVRRALDRPRFRYRVVDISLSTGALRILGGTIAWQCRSSSSYGSSHPVSSVSLNQEGIRPVDSEFVFSETRNRLTAVGCDAMAMLLSGGAGTRYSGGCVSFCATNSSVVDGTCSGVGCCQAPMPKGLKTLSLELQSIREQLSGSAKGGARGGDGVGGLCNKAFIVDKDWYGFLRRDLYADPRNDSWQVVLEWSISSGGGCEEARRRSSPLYACQENADCYDAPSGIGYRCNCSHGYTGNPYLPPAEGGCKDINECLDKKGSPCTHKCINNFGSFNCTCPIGMTGDGTKEGSGCSRDKNLYIRVGGVLALMVVLAILGFWTFWITKKRNLAKQKQRHFLQNGGLFLQQQICAQRAPTRIFTSSELEIATNNFSDSNIIGRGGYGTVYKGLLSDRIVVAIKKSKLVDESQMEQFINELVILSQIKHKNVVKLLGCCLETEVPLLVYEFISNGALFHHLHNNKTVPIPWETRLRIAVETASALAYLHLATKVPIIHRDVKSANILLDDSYTTKVSDFGASRLVPSNQTHLTTLVQGTLGYLDPEYFQTSQLTDKSDVYSFGVVLVELLTREKPIGYHRPEEGRNLASHFATLSEQNRLLEIVDNTVVKEAGIRHVNVVAKLALRCLRLRGEERPRMVEVAIELEALRRLMKQHMSLKCEKELRKLRDQSGLMAGNDENFLIEEENDKDQICEEEVPSLCHNDMDVSESMDATLLMSMDIPW